MSQYYKKGISEMVSYVLLIVIAIGLSVIVYAYLKTLVPKPDLQCPDEIALIAQPVTCTQGQLNITFLNKGYFKVIGAYVRFDKESVKVRKDLQGNNKSAFWLTTGSEQGLNPGNYTLRSYNLTEFLKSPGYGTGQTYILEIQPAIFNEKGVLIACDRAVSIQNVICSSIP